MGRQRSPVEVRSWIKGLITEASPLTYPENASIEEVNFVLNPDGSRHRRLGMDFEEGSAPTTTTISDPNAVIAVFNWKNVGGDATKDFLVVQVGNEITVLEQGPSLAYSIIHTKVFTGVDVTTRFTFTSVDGLLIVATGDKEVHTLVFKDYANITWVDSILKVRDLFGVEDIWDNKDLKAGNEISTRPSELLDPHTYNLRNQTFGIARRTTGTTIADPINSFLLAVQAKTPEVNQYPSNSDQVTQALYADTEDSTNRTVDRFHPEDLIDNPIGNFEAANGHFIIDALERGASRMEALSRMKDKYPTMMYDVTTLPTDKTPNGASVVGEYAGRVWYGGFSGEIEDGDAKSPRMSSYVLFSRLVRDPTDITECYQIGDPTSKDNPDIVDTDGGYIRIDGAYGIRGFVNVDKGMAVLAANGVWMISGGDQGFSATNYKVDKIHDRGIIGDNTLVVVDNTFMFWASEGIYHAKQNDYGIWSVQNITRQTIQKLYDLIPDANKRKAFGIYDTYERKVRWVYQDDDQAYVKELVLDATLGAFYLNHIHNPTDIVAKVIAPVLTLPSGFTEGVDVFRREVKYLTVTQYSPVIQYQFSQYKGSEYYDWIGTGNGLDAKAYMLTGYISGGDFQRKKQIIPITFHMRNTEGVFVTNPDGDLIPSNPCSCLVRVQWEWTDNISSGKWSKQFQIFRKKRMFYYDTENQSDGYPVVSSETNLRGSGRVLALYFETEAGKDCNILGWSMVMGMNTNV